MRGDALHRGDEFVVDTRDVPVPGRHNRGNLCAVLTAIEALGFDGAALAPHAASFRPLPHRLQMLGVRSEEHTSELPSLMRISYAVFCLKKTKHRTPIDTL